MTGNAGLEIIIHELRGARADLRADLDAMEASDASKPFSTRHFHRYAPGHSLDRQLMLYCSCGSQVNCSAWKSAVGAGTLHWNQAYIGLQAQILREGRGG